MTSNWPTPLHSREPLSLSTTRILRYAKRVNLRRELYGNVFEPLREATYFARAYLDPDSRTVAWPNGADFAPDFLYHYELAERPAEPAARPH